MLRLIVPADSATDDMSCRASRPDPEVGTRPTPQVITRTTGEVRRWLKVGARLPKL